MRCEVTNKRGQDFRRLRVPCHDHRALHVSAGSVRRGLFWAGSDRRTHLRYLLSVSNARTLRGFMEERIRQSKEGRGGGTHRIDSDQVVGSFLAGGWIR